MPISEKEDGLDSNIIKYDATKPTWIEHILKVVQNKEYPSKNSDPVEINLGYSLLSGDVQKFTVDATTIKDSTRNDFHIILPGSESGSNSITFNRPELQLLIPMLIAGLKSKNVDETLICKFINMMGKYFNQNGLLNMGQTVIYETIAQGYEYTKIPVLDRIPFTIDLRNIKEGNISTIESFELSQLKDTTGSSTEQTEYDQGSIASFELKSTVNLLAETATPDSFKAQIHKPTPELTEWIGFTAPYFHDETHVSIFDGTAQETSTHSKPESDVSTDSPAASRREWFGVRRAIQRGMNAAQDENYSLKDSILSGKFTATKALLWGADPKKDTTRVDQEKPSTPDSSSSKRPGKE